MNQFYLLPVAFSDSPRGGAVRIAGGLTYVSQFQLIEREAGNIARQAYFSASELPGALPNDAREQWEALTAPREALQCGESAIPLDQPQVMGILNLTPDSFSDGGTFLDPEIAEVHAVAMLKAGAAIIDVGGESTRPGAAAVTEGEEIARVTSTVSHIAAMGAAISVDTRRPRVMAAASAAGAHIFNDVSGLRHDPCSAAMAAQGGWPVVLMHAPGPSTEDSATSLHENGNYRNVVLDVFDWLRNRRDAALAAGIAKARIILDPGIGFGKSQAENLALMNALPLFHALGCPLLLGVSRKRIITALSGAAPAQQRLGGSLALALKGLEAGIQIIRVHDVTETVQATRVWRRLRDQTLAH